MRTLSQIASAAQQAVNTRFTGYQNPSFAKNYLRLTLLDRQAKDNNRTGRPACSSEDLAAARDPSVAPRFSYNFGQIPIFSRSQTPIQAKLAIREPNDGYEQEANRIAERVMRLPEPQLQRACDCGGARSSCQSKPQHSEADRLRAKSMGDNSASQIVAPPFISEALNSSGQPLDAQTRAYFEPRFGHDFSRVRVHAGARAAQSARAVNALAFTVGSDIVFGAGGFQPAAARGKKLLAHELAHVVQQTGAPTPSLQRWQISGGSAISDQDSDKLPALAIAAGAQSNDWKCIRPVRMEVALSAQQPADFNDHYERHVSLGDEFDISNLRAPFGSSRALHMFNETNLYTAVTKKFYPGVVGLTDVDSGIAAAAQFGLKPIGDFVIVGHSNSQAMFGDASVFKPKELNPEEPTPGYAGTQLGIFPRRCWFTRNATVRSVGCDSEGWGQDFVNHFLRQGAKVTTTTAAVRGRCSGSSPQYVAVAGVCRALDGFEFASSYLSYGVSLEGPFWSTEKFHAGTYWSDLKGTL